MYKSVNTLELDLSEFMGKKCVKINQYLYKMTEECICNKDDIRSFPDFPIGVLQSPIKGDTISILYFIVGFPDRYKLMDFIDDGTITEKELYYMENLYMDSTIGGIEYV